MSLVGKAIQQPEERLSYEWDLTTWAADRGVTISSATVAAEEPGISVDAYTLVGTKVRVWVSGGTLGSLYTLTATLRLQPGDLTKLVSLQLLIKRV